MKTFEPRVCVVDDDSSVREAVESLVRSEGFAVETFATAEEFLNRHPATAPACLILDVDMPRLSGLELQEELARQQARIPIVFLTGKGNIPMSVRAMKAGAVEFLTKPVDPDLLMGAIREGMLSREYDTAADLGKGSLATQIVGESAAWRRVLKQVEIVAHTESTVLLLGETGAGKEIIAGEIHRRSQRRDRPLVRVNCASIPKELYESEFFGHVKGAFTGALKDRAGRFETAEGGTLFLDEVGEIPLELQSKLLRVLQEKQYERIGDDRTRRADVRIIAATNRDLKKEVEAGRFRQDLYYRLNVFPLQIAPLRERGEDIPLLTRHFVDLAVKEMGCRKPRLTEAAVERLRSYDWPGNIRELHNVVERAVILAAGGALEFDLPTPQGPPPPAVSGSFSQAETEFLTECELQRRERENLLAVLTKTHWKITGADGAAELLGMKPTTLFSRIKKMGLKRPDEISRAA